MKTRVMSGVQRVVCILSILGVSVSLPSSAHGQGTRLLWLHLKPDVQISSAATPDQLGITKRALWRRAKVLPLNRLIDASDLPVDPAALDEIRATGVRVRTISRWLGAVSVEAKPDQVRALQSLQTINRISPVGVYRRMPDELHAVAPTPAFQKRSSSTSLDYGSSFTQLNLLKVIPLHDAGINGGGVIVGMIDDGYNNHRVHEATAGNNVLAEYDFIQGDENTSFEAGDYPGQGNHGMYTYSALSGFTPGALIGPAHGSSFLLAKTEVIGSETQIEEDLYVQGLEWLERQGADIVSSSLGYIDWYTYADLDGGTAITTQAARIATRKGVLLVTAMGNEGWYQPGLPGITGTMIAPADADSVISVGAVSSTSVLASFSSTGPTADGRIKPEVVAQGISVVCASPVSFDGYVAVNGTSLSTPLTAGIAALVLSAHPTLTPAEVREAMMATAVQIDDGTSKTTAYPNNFYGHGLVDALEAVLYHGPAFSNRPTIVDRGENLEVSMAILSNTVLPADSLFVYYQVGAGGAFSRASMTATTVAGHYSATIPKSAQSTYPRGYVSAYSPSTGTLTSPYNAPDSLFVFSMADTSGRGSVVSSFVLQPNYPNPFNAGTTISYDAPYSARTQLTIYTLLGQRVVTLFDGDAAQGRNVVFWDGRDGSGARVPSGVYVSRLSSPQGTQSRRLMILK